MSLRDHIWLALLINQVLREVIPYIKNLYRENKQFKQDLIKGQDTIKDDHVEMARMFLEWSKTQKP